MRILVVQESNWIAKGPHQSHHLMERLVSRGHDVRVIDFDIVWRRDPERKILSSRLEVQAPPKAIPGAAITVVRPGIVQLPVIEYLSLLTSHRKEIIYQMETFKPDVVVGFGILNAKIAISQCRSRGIPFVYYIIDELHRLVPQPFFQGIARSIERSNYERSDLVLSINEALRDYTIGMGASPEKTRVIRAGIDLDWLKHADRQKKREELGISPDDIVLFFMGWLYEFSGIREVASALVKEDAPGHLKLLVVGEGALWDDLQKLKSTPDVKGRIITVGWQPYASIPDFLAASDICILPAQNNEIMRNIVPIKMYEYMAAGKPVIATKLPGIMKEFGTDNGVVYVENAEGVVRNAVMLSQNGSMMHLGEKARAFVKQNDWETITNRFEETLRGMVHAR